MSEPTDVPAPATHENTASATRSPAEIAKAERAARLAKALRDNLRRRKATTAKRTRPEN